MTLTPCVLVCLLVSAGPPVLLPPSQQGESKAGHTDAKGTTPMRATFDPAGQVEIREGDRLVLRYNYATIEPGQVLAQVTEGNRIYTRPRSDYIHPLYGLEGEELTKDWALDHPHHRGIYWAWPEVDFRGERGDLHALQRVFARSAGKRSVRTGLGYAEITAENRWMWEDREPIVRERAVIRAYRQTEQGRIIDLELRFEAIKEEVSLARRGTDKYGGLNIRLAAVAGQQIAFHTDPPEASPRRAWADLSGVFAGGSQTTGISVFQHRANPDYPGDWVQYPELNWFQPTFPAPLTRHVLKKGHPLTLRFRLWIHHGAAASDPTYARLWEDFNRTGLPQGEKR